MAVEPDQLVTFARVASQGNLTEAAERLNISQPAVSAQLKRLTEAVGEPLYARHRYGITLTPAGQALLPSAQALVRALEGARHVAGELKGLRRGALYVTASMTIAVYLLPQILADFRRQQPDIALYLLTRNSQEALTLLEAGDADLALVEGPLDDVPADLERSVLLHDRLVLIVKPDHPLARRSRVALSDLAGLDMVFREAGSGTREVVERALARHNVTPVRRLDATGIEAVKEAVLHGLGASILSMHAVRREAELGLLKATPIDSDGFVRPMTLLHPNVQLCSIATRVFVEFLKHGSERIPSEVALEAGGDRPGGG